MNLDQIINAMSLWQDKRNDKNYLFELYAKADQYEIIIPENLSLSDSDFLHSYPGIINDKLFFFTIPSAYDNAEQDFIESYVISSPTFKSPETEVYTISNESEIPDPVAHGRIQVWRQHYPGWVTKTVPSEYGVYQVFAIPTSYLQSGKQYRCFFALSGQVPQGVDADLILTSTEDLVIYPKANSINQFYDTVTPCPPFHAETGVKEDYYLLEVAERE